MLPSVGANGEPADTTCNADDGTASNAAAVRGEKGDRGNITQCQCAASQTGAALDGHEWAPTEQNRKCQRAKLI